MHKHYFFWTGHFFFFNKLLKLLLKCNKFQLPCRFHLPVSHVKSRAEPCSWTAVGHSPDGKQRFSTHWSIPKSLCTEWDLLWAGQNPAKGVQDLGRVTQRGSSGLLPLTHGHQSFPTVLGEPAWRPALEHHHHQAQNSLAASSSCNRNGAQSHQHLPFWDLQESKQVKRFAKAPELLCEHCVMLHSIVLRSDPFSTSCKTLP